MSESPITPEVLGRFMTIAQQYQRHFYCILSHSIGIVPPKTQAPPISDRTPYFSANVFSYRGPDEFDPMVCAVQGSTLSELAKNLHRALDEAGEGPNPASYLPASGEQVAAVLDLLKDSRTCGPTRLHCFEQLVPMLNQWDANEMGNMLVDRITSRQPGGPGYAAMHGLLGEGKD